MNTDFSFNWTPSSIQGESNVLSNEQTVHNNYEKRDSFCINGYKVINSTQSSMGEIEVTHCFLNLVYGRDGVKLSNCSANNVTSPMGKVTWKGWNGYQEEPFPSIDGRDGVLVSSLSTQDISSSEGKVWLTDGKANEISARDGIILTNSTVHEAETSMGVLQANNCTIMEISARDGIELHNSKVHSAETSRGMLQAENSEIDEIEAQVGVVIKNCKGGDIISSMGKIFAISENSNEKPFFLFEARDGIDLKGVSAKKVLSSMGAVNCNGGNFEIIQCAKSSLLTHCKIIQLKISVKKDEELTVDLTDSQVTEVLVKVMETDNRVRGGNVSSKSIVGNTLSWSLDGSTLTANPNSFLVEETLSSPFKQEIQGRCKLGARGLINGISAQVTSSGIVLQKEGSGQEMDEVTKENRTQTKVIFIGGKILSNIFHKEPVELDVSQTTLLKEIIFG